MEERHGQNRSDMRVTGPAAPNGGLVEYDLTCVSVHTLEAQQRHTAREGKEVMAEHGFSEGVRKAVRMHMDWKAERKVKKYTGIITEAFMPLVVTLEGAMTRETTATFKHWRSMCASWSMVQSTISCILLWTRAETYCLW